MIGCFCIQCSVLTEDGSDYLCFFADQALGEGRGIFCVYYVGGVTFDS